VQGDAPNGDKLRREMADLKTALAVAETVLDQVKDHLATEHEYRIKVSLQLATITERLATQQRIIWALMAVILTEGAGMAMYVLRTLLAGAT
jgi:hypothetical protein